MNYLNLHTDILRGVEFIGADPVERATWIALLGWCVTQENGGVIANCKSWKSRQWQQLAGVTDEEVKTTSKLYGFEGENLVVNFYPIESEAAVKAKREKGKLGGRPKKIKKDENPDKTKGKNLMDSHMDNPSENHMANHDRKVKKRKEKELNIYMSDKSDELEKDLLLALWNSAPEKARRRSSRKQVFDAWKKIPKNKRPDKNTAIDAIEAWGECEDWTKDDGNFVQGLHLWLKNEKWIDPPKRKEIDMRRILK